MQGLVKYVRGEGSFAFVGGDDGIDDYCHPAALRRAGITDLKVGDRLEYQRCYGAAARIIASIGADVN